MKRRFHEAVGRLDQTLPPVQKIRALQNIGAFLGEDPTRCYSWDLLSLLQTEERKLVRFQANGKQQEATVVFDGSKFDRETFRVRGWVADDTAHITEDLYATTNFKPGEKSQLIQDPAFAAKLVATGLGDAGEMHDGKIAYQPMVGADGRVPLPANYFDREKIFFVVYQEGPQVFHSPSQEAP